MIRDYDAPEPEKTPEPKDHWNRPELIRDYDNAVVKALIDNFLLDWNRPELIRDYDSIFLCSKKSYYLFDWNRPELIRDYDSRRASRCSSLISLKQTWIDKGLRRSRHRLMVSIGLSHWNRPELIRDYDVRSLNRSRCRWCRLKQTWIDKGLRRAFHQIFKSAFHELKQTWIDKGLRPNAETGCLRRRSLKQTWIDKGLRRTFARRACVAIFQIETDLNW